MKPRLHRLVTDPQRFPDAPKAPRPAATVWALAAGAHAAELLREGGTCSVELGGDLLRDVVLDDGRRFERCRVTMLDLERTEIVLCGSSLGEISLVTTARVVACLPAEAP